MTNTDEILRHLNQITGQRDQNLVSITLLKSISEMLMASYCAHLTFDSKLRPIQSVELADDEFRFLTEGEIDPEVMQLVTSEDSGTLATRNRTTSIKGIPTTVFEANVTSEEKHVLVVSRFERFDEHELRILLGMLRIYENFHNLLSESQLDELTRLPNRKTFETAAGQVSLTDTPPISVDGEQNRRAGHSENERTWLAMIDVDDFKRINDDLGHLYGDEILIELADLLRESFRHEDNKFRFGGEEFVVMIRASNEEQCRQVMERFLQKVREHRFSGDLTVTVSAGLVEFRPDVFHKTSLDLADQALYFCKGNGKDQAAFYEDLIEEGQLAGREEPEGGDVDLF